MLVLASVMIATVIMNATCAGTSSTLLTMCLLSLGTLDASMCVPQHVQMLPLPLCSTPKINTKHRGFARNTKNARTLKTHKQNLFMGVSQDLGGILFIFSPSKFVLGHVCFGFP